MHQFNSAKIWSDKQIWEEFVNNILWFRREMVVLYISETII